MRPTGVVLIALYHFLSALFLVFLAVALFIGGSLPLLVGAGPLTSGLGILVGAVGAIFFFVLALVAAIAGYGMWTFREWGRILCILLAILSLLFSVPGLLMIGLHFSLFFGTYRLFRIAISILIIWYLVQPQTRALFQRITPATPGA
jgi:hypothetical protein